MPMIHLAKRVTFLIDKNGFIQEIQRGSEANNPSNALDSCNLLEHRKQESAAQPQKAAKPK
jgi:peroxiredoxin